METRTIVVSPEDAKKRIDIFLNEELDLLFVCLENGAEQIDKNYHV